MQGLRFAPGSDRSNLGLAVRTWDGRRGQTTFSILLQWFRFLGKWSDPARNPQFKPELDSFLKKLRDERGYTDQTISTREETLNLFFEWLGKQGVSLKEVTPEILAAYSVQNKARGWKKTTVNLNIHCGLRCSPHDAGPR
ncbi:MAG: site-specific integrase [Acidobacteriia bacterium]|nr:site-specific integrase [Terriglobia bacterium]